MGLRYPFHSEVAKNASLWCLMIEYPNLIGQLTEELDVLEDSHFIKTIRISNYSELSISYVNYVMV